VGGEVAKWASEELGVSESVGVSGDLVGEGAVRSLSPSPSLSSTTAALVVPP
jgi:hypothetical protein